MPAVRTSGKCKLLSLAGRTDQTGQSLIPWGPLRGFVLCVTICQMCPMWKSSLCVPRVPLIFRTCGRKMRSQPRGQSVSSDMFWLCSCAVHIFVPCLEDLSCALSRCKTPTEPCDIASFSSFRTIYTYVYVYSILYIIYYYINICIGPYSHTIFQDESDDSRGLYSDKIHIAVLLRTEWLTSTFSSFQYFSVLFIAVLTKPHAVMKPSLVNL